MPIAQIFEEIAATLSRVSGHVVEAVEGGVKHVPKGFGRTTQIEDIVLGDALTHASFGGGRIQSELTHSLDPNAIEARVHFFEKPESALVRLKNFEVDLGARTRKLHASTDKLTSLIGEQCTPCGPYVGVICPYTERDVMKIGTSQIYPKRANIMQGRVAALSRSCAANVVPGSLMQGSQEIVLFKDVSPEALAKISQKDLDCHVR